MLCSGCSRVRFCDLGTGCDRVRFLVVVGSTWLQYGPSGCSRDYFRGGGAAGTFEMLRQTQDARGSSLLLRALNPRPT